MLIWTAAARAEPTVGGVVVPVLVADVAHDYRYEDSFEEHTWARGWASGDLPRGDRWFLEVRFQTHLLFGEKTSNDGTRAVGWWEVGAGDSGWDGKIAGPVRARVGLLTERWGRLDLLPVADVINPRDLRVGPLIPAEFQRIPIPMGVISVESDRIEAETVLVPYATADRLWLRDEDWSYVRQGMIEGELNEIVTSDAWDVPGADSQILGNLELAFPLPDSLRRGLDATANGRNLPEELLYNGEIAERIQLHTAPVDLSLMGGWVHAREPVARLKPELRRILRTQVLPDDFTDIQGAVLRDPVGPLLVDWPRTAVVGADGAGLAGPIEIRAETLYQSQRPVRMWYGDALSAPQLGAGLALGYLRGSTLAVTLESRWQHLFLPDRVRVCTPADVEPSRTHWLLGQCLLFSLPNDFQIAGGTRITALHNRLTVQIGGSLDLSFAEYFFRPSAAWRFGDHVNVELGALLLGGATPAPQDLDEALTYTGGLSSYFSDNDAITLSVGLIR